MNNVNLILKCKKYITRPQPFTNQSPENQTSVTLSFTGKSNINRGIANTNVFASHFGEESSEESIPIPTEVMMKLASFYPTFSIK